VVVAEQEREKAVSETEYERDLGLARLEASRLIGDFLFDWAMEKGHRSLPAIDGRELRLKRLERYYEDFLMRTSAIASLDDERARVCLQLAEVSLASGNAEQAEQRLDEAIFDFHEAKLLAANGEDAKALGSCSVRLVR
jgi:hypothetical protein